MDERRDDRLRRSIRAKAVRKLRAQRDGTADIWKGLGMMGLIGWSVTIPTLLGAALGFWIDSRALGTLSWTLTLLILGLGVGCANAWFWVRKESEVIEEDDSDG